LSAWLSEEWWGKKVHPALPPADFRNVSLYFLLTNNPGNFFLKETSKTLGVMADLILDNE
jgi:hypothetical protein